MNIEKYRQYKKSGSKKLLNELIVDNIKLVHKIASKHLGSLKGTLLEVDDLIQSGTEGLMRSFDSYDESKGAFSTYAAFWIRYYCQECIRGDASIKRSRKYHPTMGTYNQIAVFEAKHGRTPSREELDIKKNHPMPGEIEMLVVDKLDEPVQNSKRLGAGEEIITTLHDIIPGVSVDAFENLADSERGRLVTKHMLKRPVSEWQVLVSVLVSCKTYRETSRALKVSEQEVKDLCEGFASEISQAYD